MPRLNSDKTQCDNQHCASTFDVAITFDVNFSMSVTLCSECVEKAATIVNAELKRLKKVTYAKTWVCNTCEHHKDHDTWGECTDTTVDRFEEKNRYQYAMYHPTWCKYYMEEEEWHPAGGGVGDIS